MTKLKLAAAWVCVIGVWLLAIYFLVKCMIALAQDPILIVIICCMAGVVIFALVMDWAMEVLKRHYAAKDDEKKD